MNFVNYKLLEVNKKRGKEGENLLDMVKATINLQDLTTLL